MSGAISLGLARKLADQWVARDELRIEADDVSAARAAVEAMRSVPKVDRTPAVLAQWCAVLSELVGESEFAHWENMPHVIQSLDECHDLLKGVGQ